MERWEDHDDDNDALKRYINVMMFWWYPLECWEIGMWENKYINLKMNYG